METLRKALDFVRAKTDFVPKIAVVLGSGLGGFADTVRAETCIDYDEIPGFPTSTVAGHKGRFVFGTIDDVPIVLMQGRVHYYEGYTMQQVVMPIRLLRMLGVEILFLTNAAGGINRKFQPGDLMLLTGQISNFVPSPLIGANFDELGPRFPDMSHIYDPNLCDVVTACAERHNIHIKKGVYLQVSGPNYESPEEIRMFGILGADAVGMSTACEAIAAVHAGMRVCAISCITNLAAGIQSTPLSHREVQETADRVSRQFETLLHASLCETATHFDEIRFTEHFDVNCS